MIKPCPKCSRRASSFEVRVVFHGMAIIQVGKDREEFDVLDIEPGDSEWDEESEVRCRDCGWVGKMGELEEE